MKCSCWSLLLGLSTLGMDGVWARDIAPRVTGAVRRQARDRFSDMTYPTTISNVHSTTSAFSDVQGSRRVVLTVTSIEYWATEPPDFLFNYTIVETISSSETTLLVDDSATTTVASKTGATESTWVLWDTAATDLPVHASPLCNAGCTAAAWKPEPQCAEAGLDTACVGQCDIRDWIWWCYKPDFSTPSKPAMGRVCWDGKQTAYRPLLEPCDSADHRADCGECAVPSYDDP